MAPHAVEDLAVTNDSTTIAGLKAGIHVEHVERTFPSPSKPVADNFMYDFKYNHPLPTTDVLGVDVPAQCNAQKEAEGIMARLAAAMGEGDAQAFTDMFLEYGKSLSYLYYFAAANALRRLAR